jgi:chlorite dismutase
MLKLGAVVFCLSVGVGNVVTVEAADNPAIVLYRYVDSRGVTVLDTQGVPPEYVGKGYEVLNQRGRVIQVVPPAPSADEVRQAQAAKVQADADAQLTHLYSSLSDIDRARTRRLAELDALIAVAQGNVQGLAAQQSTLQGQAADQERAGRQVPKTLLDQIDDLRDQQQNLKGDIVRYKAARQQADAAFAVDRARLQKLLQP